MEEESEDLGWSDAARTTIAVQVSGLILSTTLACVDSAWGLALLSFYLSLTAATQRNRRSLAAPLQVLLASLLSRLPLRPLAVLTYVTECLFWRTQTVDLLTAFARFQKNLFATIILATAWGMPVLYDAAESLETQATGITLEDEFYQQFAGALLYGGTVLLLSVSVAVWVRMYRVHPELFRLLLAVAATGAAAGILLRVAGEEDRDVLTGASCCSFVAMAYCVLPDRTPHLFALLALFLHGARKLSRPHFALLCFSAQLLIKFLFAFQLHTLGSRVPRHSPRLVSPILTFLFPISTS